jgi:serine/threonine protein kinase
MELIDARSLQEILDDGGPMPAVRAAALGRQVLAALAHAHAKGVLHRDVKPSNVLVTPDGRAVLTDFGIAYRQGDPRLTQTGAAIGSPAYMAPEQIQGGPVTGAADLWSLGVTLYAAVEGASPFQRTDPMASVAAVLTAEPPPPQHAGPLTPVLAGLLQHDPARRLTAAAAMDALNAIAAGQPAATVTLPTGGPAADKVPSATHPTPMLPATLSKPSRTVAFTTFTVVAVVFALTAITIIWANSRGQHNNRTAGAATGSSVAAATSASAPASASAGQVNGATPSGNASGYHRYQDRSGFSIPVPDGWSGPDRQGSSVFFYSPDHNSLIQIDQTTTPSASAIQDWRNLETTLSQNRPGYHRIKIAPTGTAPPVPDATGDRSADWEYTYDRSTGRRHVLDRGFATNGHGYAILIAAPDSQWTTTQTQLSPIYAGFTSATN